MSFERRSYDGGGATTTLQTDMGSSDMSFVLSSATNWPGTPAADFSVVIDRNTPNEEKVLCSSNTGTTVTVVTRGIDGTTATTHSASAFVSLCGIAQDFDEANQVSNLFGNLAEGSLVIGQGAATLSAELTAGTTGQVLTMGASDPEWSTPTASPTTNYATAAVTLSVSVTAATPTNIVSVSLSAGTWLIQGQAIISPVGSAADYCTIWLGPTSASGTGAYSAANGSITASQLGATSLSTSVIVVLATTTTVYLEAYTAGYDATVNDDATPTSTGTKGSAINAVRIA